MRYLMIQIGFKSSKGIKRSNNEDACFVMPREKVYIVADGVGGNNAGELASRTAVTFVADYIKDNPFSDISGDDALGNHMRTCVEEANRRVFALAQKHEENKGMATTLVICHIRDGKAYIVNVGDSRAYVFRGGELFQITEDHTYVNSLIKMGVITEAEARDHQKGHMITRALGAEETIEADFYQTDIRGGDVMLLCTDGLYGEMKSDRIARIMKKEENMSALAETLISEANKAGGRDNITVICIKINGGEQNEQ